MPIYEYGCSACGRVHEIFQKYGDEPLTACPYCGGNVRKLISNTSFVLKGTGWYKTDYAAADAKRSPNGAEKTGETPGKKREAAAEAKSEAKAELKTETTSKSGE